MDMIKKGDKRTMYTDSEEFIEELKEHVDKNDDLKSVNQLIGLATRQFLQSRRNKGHFKRH